MINKDNRKLFARKKGNENPIWGWNDSTIGLKNNTGGEDIVVVKNGDISASVSYFESCRECMWTVITEKNGGYIDCQYLVATSNTIEFFFSVEKHVLMSIYKRISLIMFKAIMIFKKNRSFWYIILAAKGVKVPNLRGTDRDNDLFYYHEWE